MGKMIDAQSIVVASTCHPVVRPRGRHPPLRVLSQLGLAALMGILVFLQAYVYPFTLLVVR